MRYVSLLLRRRHARQERARTLRAFEEWRTLVLELPPPQPRRGTLLLIRLDDIGDYLLFRNQLPLYKRSPRWGAQAVTLLGNSSWRELFEAYDRDSVDHILWVDKGEYLTSAPYRSRIWARLRSAGFETVIAPSRTRPLLLDDLCCLAAAPVHALAAANTHVHSSWNAASDRLYHELFAPPAARLHEFHFNGLFAAWICGSRFAGNRPALSPPTTPPRPDADLICFIGASTRSRRWPAKRWIEFIRLYRQHHAGAVILAGGSRAEQELAVQIQTATAAQSIAGQVSLLEFARRVAAAKAVLSNDTMAVHLGVACGRPTVVIANGVNYERFTDYGTAGIDGVATRYPRVFTRRRECEPNLVYRYADALTADVASITAADVLTALDQVLR